ncbi:DUF2281 domain-containing protein [bacterium]|nr:DUF2281 domain-containing protein [bacterium]
MVIAEKIQQYVQRLPAALQAEVLDFVEYLLAKVEGNTLLQEERTWSDLSLTYAMRGMEEEDTPTYTVSDLKAIFS